MTQRKTTDQHLVQELMSLNADKYSKIIEKAKALTYHDFKSDLVSPKLELVKDLDSFPELNEIREAVMRGDYDETPDESDKEQMRKDLREDGASEEFMKILGL